MKLIQMNLNDYVRNIIFPFKDIFVSPNSKFDLCILTKLLHSLLLMRFDRRHQWISYSFTPLFRNTFAQNGAIIALPPPLVLQHFYNKGG